MKKKLISSQLLPIKVKKKSFHPISALYKWKIELISSQLLFYFAYKWKKKSFHPNSSLYKLEEKKTQSLINKKRNSHLIKKNNKCLKKKKNLFDPNSSLMNEKKNHLMQLLPIKMKSQFSSQLFFYFAYEWKKNSYDLNWKKRRKKASFGSAVKR